MEDYLKKENPIKIENELVFINAFTSDIRKRIHGRCSHSHVTLNSFKNEYDKVVCLFMYVSKEVCIRE